jgi:hypothetical protein
MHITLSQCNVDGEAMLACPSSTIESWDMGVEKTKKSKATTVDEGELGGGGGRILGATADGGGACHQK